MKFNHVTLAMALITSMAVTPTVMAKEGYSQGADSVKSQKHGKGNGQYQHYKGKRVSNSDVDFSNCREIAGGIAVQKNALISLVPSDIKVNSLSDMGFVFEGSDNLGMLIIRSLQCEVIQVTDAKGRVFTDENVAFAHVGTPINTSNLPATTFNNDGSNGADFNIFALSYQTSSPAYYGAMKRMGMKTAMFNEHMINAQVDTTPGTCDVAQLSVSVPGNHDYSFSIFGEVVEATAECHPGGANFVANWWSVDRKKRVSALSNLVTDQTFTETAGPNVFVVAKPGTTMSELIGEAPSAFTGFSGSGYLPSGGIGNVDMVAEALGKLPR